MLGTSNKTENLLNNETKDDLRARCSGYLDRQMFVNNSNEDQNSLVNQFLT